MHDIIKFPGTYLYIPSKITQRDPTRKAIIKGKQPRQKKEPIACCSLEDGTGIGISKNVASPIENLSDLAPSFPVSTTSSPFISVSVYLFGKGAPCGHKHNKRRNVILRLLLAMGRRLQGRRDSGEEGTDSLLFGL